MSLHLCSSLIRIMVMASQHQLPSHNVNVHNSFVSRPTDNTVLIQPYVIIMTKVGRKCPSATSTPPSKLQPTVAIFNIDSSPHSLGIGATTNCTILTGSSFLCFLAEWCLTLHITSSLVCSIQTSPMSSTMLWWDGTRKLPHFKWTLFRICSSELIVGHATFIGLVLENVLGRKTGWLCATILILIL